MTRIKKWVKKWEGIQNEVIIKSEQQRAERLRRKNKKIKTMKDGARKAITEGLIQRKTPMQVMKDEYVRRKYEREKKYNQKRRNITKKD